MPTIDDLSVWTTLIAEKSRLLEQIRAREMALSKAHTQYARMVAIHQESPEQQETPDVALHQVAAFIHHLNARLADAHRRLDTVYTRLRELRQ
jgi:hypothetical protein